MPTLNPCLLISNMGFQSASTGINPIWAWYLDLNCRLGKFDSHP